MTTEKKAREYFGVTENVKWTDGNVYVATVVYKGDQSRDGIVRSNAVAIFKDMDHAREFVYGFDALASELSALKAENERITCGYCGALFERDWNELQEHIKVCEKHPLCQALKEITALKAKVEAFVDAYDKPCECCDEDRDRRCTCFDWVEHIEELRTITRLKE